MITENYDDYVSYEVAKLLREKGFDEPCWCWYEDEDSLIHSNDDYGYQYNSDHISYEFEYSAPTLYVAMKWLREEKLIYIEICRSINTFLYGARIVEDESGRFNKIANSLDTYEEACEAAIKYCLENLI